MPSKKYIKNIAYWTLPPGIQGALSKCIGEMNLALNNPTYRSELSLLKKNKELYNIHQGERCFILATGPSIKEEDLKVLSNETCIAVSNFFVHPDYSIIKPKYYCVAPYHLPITEDAWNNWMKELDCNTKDAKMFFGLSDLIRNRRNGLFDGRDVYFLHFGRSWDNFIDHELDLTHQVPGPQSVSVMALFIALYMGFNEIYLLGCDHNWITSIGKSTHFYDEQQHKLVQNGYNEWFENDIEPYFHDYISLWQQYKKIKKVVDRKKVKIVNLSSNSLLDVFPKMNLESIVSISK